MRSLNKGAAILMSCFVLALVLLAPAMVHGDEWNLATKFKVNQPFEVPGMVLQPNTTYMIRLLDSPSNRGIVQIYNEDQSKMLAMFMAVSDERVEVTDRTVFTFVETQPGYPLPIKEWFYPGRSNGLEFIYPKEQARTIAQHAREPILSADAGKLHDLSSIHVEAISPVTRDLPVTSSAANITKSENTAVFEEKPSVTEPTPQASVTEEQKPVEEQQPQSEIAQNTDSDLNQNIQREKPAEAPAAPEQTTNNTQELPRTAGELPLIGLIGLVCLGAGLGLKVTSSHN